MQNSVEFFQSNRKTPHSHGPEAAGALEFLKQPTYAMVSIV
jgi:hypothetical protein